MALAYKFTDIDKKSIIDNFENLTIRSIMEKYNTSFRNVKKLLAELGLEKEGNTWNNQEDEFLISNAGILTAEEIGILLNKTTVSVQCHASKLKISLATETKNWNLDEDQKLRELWGLFSIETIAEKMNTTVISIRKRAFILKLGPPAKGNPDGYTIQEIVEIIGVSNKTIRTSWKEKGLKLKKRKISNKKFIYYIEQEELHRFLEENPELWDGNKIETYSLGKEPKWLAEKRIEDASPKPETIKWTKIKLARLRDLLSFGFTYGQIAKEFNGTYQAVKKKIYKIEAELESENYVQNLQIKQSIVEYITDRRIEREARKEQKENEEIKLTLTPEKTHDIDTAV